MTRMQKGLTVLVALLSIGVGIFTAAPVSHAQSTRSDVPLLSYDCSFPGCLGQVAYGHGDGGVLGASTYLKLEKPTCGPIGDCIQNVYYISNYVKIQDFSGAGVWYIQAGAMAPDFDHADYSYYWEDYRPQDLIPTWHWLGYVQFADLGSFANVEITQATSNSWSISVSAPYSGVLDGTSTSDNFSFNQSWLGLEMVGKMPPLTNMTQFTVDYELNYWQAATGYWHPLTTDGTPSIKAPVSAWWTTRPANSATGGIWSTECSCQ